MKKVLSVFILSALLISSNAVAAPMLFVDAAPNVYGSPDYDPWLTGALAAVADGSFVNMSNGTNPENVGTTNFEIQDEVVYSFGDLGKRLTWIYWIPDEDIAGLAGRVQVSLTNIWDGEEFDFYEYYYKSTWVEPSKWVDYDADGDGITDGVIGTAGMAWWGAYNVNTQEALDADIASWGMAEEDWIFTLKMDGVDYSILSHRSAPVPEPATILLLSAGLLGMGVSRKKKP